MRLTFILFLMGYFLGFNCHSQTDSTDLTLSIDSVVLATQMDSVLFGGPDFKNYKIEFTISDTLNFEKFIIELSVDGQLLNRKMFTLTELQSDTTAFSNWNVTMDFGNFENTQTYRVMLKVCEVSGVCGSALFKTF